MDPSRSGNGYADSCSMDKIGGRLVGRGGFSSSLESSTEESIIGSLIEKLGIEDENMINMVHRQNMSQTSN